MPFPTFPTSPGDWQQQKAVLEARIAEHQRALEAAATWEQARSLQGAVAELRWLIAAAEPARLDGIGKATY